MDKLNDKEIEDKHRQFINFKTKIDKDYESLSEDLNFLNQKLQGYQEVENFIALNKIKSTKEMMAEIAPDTFVNTEM